MPCVIAGRLATTLTRIGLVEETGMSSESWEHERRLLYVTEDIVRRIAHSLQAGPARRLLEERGITVRGPHDSPIPDADATPSPSSPPIPSPHRDLRGDGRSADVDLQLPLTFLLAEEDPGLSLDDIDLAYFDGALPDGSITRVDERLDFGPDVYVASTPLAFLLACRHLDPDAIADFRDELCDDHARAEDNSQPGSGGLPPAMDPRDLEAGVRAILAAQSGTGNDWVLAIGPCLGSFG